MASGAWSEELGTSGGARRAYRRRSLSNLTRMGHCAPTVARTVLDLTGADGRWLARLAAGLPGGIASTGFECGAVTAGLLLLGLRYGSTTDRGLPVVVEKGHAYCGRFAACNGSLLCSAILGSRRLPLPCVRAVCLAPELLAETIRDEASLAIPPAARDAYQRLSAHLSGEGFHCAHAVLRALDRELTVTPALLAATSGFVGGTLFTGQTCSALAAGVMAVGLGAGALEDSRPRVLRMLVTMALGGDALDEGLNAFNASVKRGRSLARWFAGAFGSTQCRDVTGCTFSSAADVDRYVDGGGVTRCRAIAASVAASAGAILARARVH